MYREQINSKKRKFENAFPLNTSNESSNSDESAGTKSRKRRVLNEVRELSENVLEYVESICYLRQHKPDFEEIKVHEELVKELEDKPISCFS